MRHLYRDLPVYPTMRQKQYAERRMAGDRVRGEGKGTTLEKKTEAVSHHFERSTATDPRAMFIGSSTYPHAREMRRLPGLACVLQLS